MWPDRLTHALEPIALLALIAAGASMTGCRSAVAETRPKESPAVRVHASKVTVRDMPKSLVLTGTLAPNQGANVAADVAGKIVATHVERGTFVRSGAPLASVDSRTAALSRVQANAEVHALDAQRALAKSECERAEHLYREDVLSKAEHDRQTAQCEVTTFSAEAAQARADLAGKALGDSVIRAPFSGLVSERFVTAGEFVRQDSRIVDLVDIDTMRLELSVPESAVAHVREGQTVHFRVASFGEDFSAKIKYIGPALRRASRDLLAEASFDNPERRLKPGMFATVRLELARTDMPVVPKAALRDEGSHHHVFVIQQNRLEERIVETGPEEGDLVAVASGLVADEQIASPAGEDLKDGMAVEPIQ